MINMFNEAVENYGWMVYACIVCAVIFIVVIVILIFKPGASSDDSVEDEQDIVVKEFVKEEKNNKLVEQTVVDEVEVEDVVEIDAPECDTKIETVEAVEAVVQARVINGKYEVFKELEKYKFILKASNGGILIESELYSSKDGAINAINTVKRNLTSGSIEISKDKRNLYQFSLVAANNRVLVISANYPTEKRVQSAVESFKRFAATSPVVEVENKRKNSNMELIEIDVLEDKTGGKLFVVNDGEGFVYQLTANNGEILCKSSVYKSKNTCLDGIETLKTGVVEGTFYVVKDKRGYFQFKLYSKTNRVIALGETYESKLRAISSANSVCSFIKLAVLQ